MNRAAIALTATAAGLLLIAGRPARGGVVDQGEAAPTLDTFINNAAGNFDTFVNRVTETPAMVNDTTAARNIAAWLKMIQWAEGTQRAANPYAVCYGYRHTIIDFRDHPANTGEWRGERLPDSMCKAAGFGPGCVSTAAGAYQIRKPTWNSVRTAIGATSFAAVWQDAAAVELTRRRGALEHVKAGRLRQAIAACANEWASLPGNTYGQGTKPITELFATFNRAGGAISA